MLTLVYDVIREEEKAIIREAERMGLPLRAWRPTVLDVEECHAGVHLVRTISHLKASVVAGFLEGCGALVINPHTVLNVTWNKALTLRVLANRGIPIPRTRLLVDNGQGIHVDGEVVVKPVSGSWGRRVSLVKTGEEMATLLRHSEGPLLVQERVGDGTDIRIIVISGEVVGGMLRRPTAGDWRSNVARNGVAVKYEVGDELAEMAVKAVESVGAFYAGVDVLVDDGRFVVNEVNGIPEFKAFHRATGVNVARKLLAAIAEARKK